MSISRRGKMYFILSLLLNSRRNIIRFSKRSDETYNFHWKINVIRIFTFSRANVVSRAWLRMEWMCLESIFNKGGSIRPKPFSAYFKPFFNSQLKTYSETCFFFIVFQMFWVILLKYVIYLGYPMIIRRTVA